MADNSLSTPDDSDYGSSGNRVDVEFDENVGESSNSDTGSTASNMSPNRANFYLDLSAEQQHVADVASENLPHVSATPAVMCNGNAAHSADDSGIDNVNRVKSLSTKELLEQYQSLNRRSITSMHSPTSYVNIEIQMMPSGSWSHKPVISESFHNSTEFDPQLTSSPNRNPYANKGSSLTRSPTDSVFIVENSPYTRVDCSNSSVGWKSTKSRSNKAGCDTVDDSQETDSGVNIFTFIPYSVDIDCTHYYESRFVAHVTHICSKHFQLTVYISLLLTIETHNQLHIDLPDMLDKVNGQ
jgi:hypothetical protein